MGLEFRPMRSIKLTKLPVNKYLDFDELGEYVRSLYRFWKSNSAAISGEQSILLIIEDVVGFPIGVVSGKAIFGPPLEEYWAKKLQEEVGKEGGEGNS